MRRTDTVPSRSWGVAGGGDGAESIKDGMTQVRAAQIVGYFVFAAAPHERHFCRFCDMIGRTEETQIFIVTILGNLEKKENELATNLITDLSFSVFSIKHLLLNF